MYRFWRLFYWLLETRAVLFLAERVLRVARAGKGDQFAEALLCQFERRFVWSGWPNQSTGCVNVHLSHFAWSLRNRLRAAAPVAQAPRGFRLSRLRVGCVGRFSGLLGFPKELFEGFPKSGELVIFDMPYSGRSAPYLTSIADKYYDLAGAGAKRGAELINEADLDILLNINAKRDAYELIDRVETPCIMNFCSGADVFHHDKVDVQLYCVQEPHYFLREGQLFCALTRAPFDHHFVCRKTSFYDLRHISIDDQPAWADRDPLITFHGSLYKLATPSYLDCLFGILGADSGLELVFMGKDDGRALSMICDTARAWQVEGRVHYEGEFSAIKGADGQMPDQDWERMVSYLRRSRLACEPWPIGGGSSRIEAYACGVPSISVRIRFDPDAWGTRQLVVAEATAMHVPLGTVTTVEEYREAAQRCLVDERFATALVNEQNQVARRLTDPGEWWREFFGCFDEWRMRREPAMRDLNPVSSDARMTTA